MSAELVSALDAACSEFGEAGRVADEEVGYSLAQFSALADEVALALREEGAEPNEPVAVLVSNRAGDLAALLGVWRAGCVAAPIHRTTPAAAMEGLLERMGARFVADRRPGVAPGPEQYGLREHTGTRRGCLYVRAAPAPTPRALLENAALIIFTSGTTGLPKGAVLSHTAFAGKLGAIDSLLRFGPRTRTLLVLQITFSFGIWVSLLTLLRGGSLAMQERFAAERLVPGLLSHQATAVALVPTMIRAYLAARDDEGGRAELARLNDARCLKQVLTGGEALGAPLGERVRGLFPGAEMTDIYGLTETATSDFFLVPGDQPHHLGCIGRPSPGVTYRIADSAGRPAPPGEPGELQIRTPYIMSGYLDAPRQTAEAFSDGYFRTGDVAREKEGGVVELVGRAKEMISRGAAKVSPLEIEQLFAQHPGVAEVLVTGVPDAILGERIHIMIVPRTGVAADADALRGWAAERLEKFKLPDVFHFGGELPLGRTGKADRGALRELIAREPERG